MHTQRESERVHAFDEVCLIKPFVAGKADGKTHTDFSIRCWSPPGEREGETETDGWVGGEGGCKKKKKQSETQPDEER